jgi:23S rRNA pseudouridine2605 synthase
MKMRPIVLSLSQNNAVSEDPETPSPVRLQVFLAHAGLASRRASEQLIAQGRVALNGQIITVPGTKVLPGDEVAVDGRLLQTETRLHYLALHKPPEYLCSSHDPQGRRLALELLPRDISERLYNVGRLDYLSSGLILFTNDGDFAARMSHPRSEIEKEYLVESTGIISDDVVRAFLEGVIIEEICYKALDIQRLGRKMLKIVLIEGKNREIRRVFSHFHLHPKRLERIRIGSILLGDLVEGKTRPLTDKELLTVQGGM